MAKKILNKIRIRRSKRVRAKITGTARKPRLSIFRSNQHTYAQLIDDVAQKTIAFASTKNKDGDKKDKGNKISQANALGKMIAEKAKKISVESVIFDRGKYAYHGRVKAIAEILRKEGIKI